MYCEVWTLLTFNEKTRFGIHMQYVILTFFRILLFILINI